MSSAAEMAVKGLPGITTRNETAIPLNFSRSRSKIITEFYRFGGLLKSDAFSKTAIPDFEQVTEYVQRLCLSMQSKWD